MIELIRHIEILLLNNDCVVVPGLGGFITHYVPATWSDDTNVFLPPTRTIGFNPQLKMNDGTLAQSYMEAYGTDFSDATKIIQKSVDELIDTLHKEETIAMENIGELSLSIHGAYTFSPYEDKIFSPSLYGLDAFEIKDLKALHHSSSKEAIPHIPVAEPKKNYEIRIRRSFVRNIVATAAAIALFFYLSSPIENTYVERANYAQLLPADLFGKIEQQSLLTSIITIAETGSKAEVEPERVVEEIITVSKTDKSEIQQPATTTVKTTPVKVKEVKVPKAEATTTTVDATHKQPTKLYHIIIASVAFKDDAQAIVSDLKTKGYPDASVLTSDGKVRISLMSCPTRQDADTQLAEVRKNSTYQNAWLLAK